MQNIFILPILNLSCLPLCFSAHNTVLSNFSGANPNFPLCASLPQPTHYLLLPFQQNLSNLLIKPNAVGKKPANPAPAYVCCMCHSLLSQCLPVSSPEWGQHMLSGWGEEEMGRQDHWGKWKREGIAVCRETWPGTEHHSWRRFWLLLYKEERRQEGKTVIRGICLL